MANINNPDVIIKANVVQGESVIKAYPSLNPTASTERKGIIRIATDNEALEGTDKTIAITPHTLKEFVDNTVNNYGDIVTHNVDEFATAIQGGKADSAIQPADIGIVARTNSYDDIDNQPQVNGITLSGNKSSKDLGIIYYKEFGTINIEIPQGIK